MHLTPIRCTSHKEISQVKVTCFSCSRSKLNACHSHWKLHPLPVQKANQMHFDPIENCLLLFPQYIKCMPLFLKIAFITFWFDMQAKNKSTNWNWHASPVQEANEMHATLVENCIHFLLTEQTTCILLPLKILYNSCLRNNPNECCTHWKLHPSHSHSIHKQKRSRPIEYNMTLLFKKQI